MYAENEQWTHTHTHIRKKKSNNNKKNAAESASWFTRNYVFSHLIDVINSKRLLVCIQVTTANSLHAWCGCWMYSMVTSRFLYISIYNSLYIQCRDCFVRDSMKPYTFTDKRNNFGLSDAFEFQHLWIMTIKQI